MLTRGATRMSIVLRERGQAPSDDRARCHLPEVPRGVTFTPMGALPWLPWAGGGGMGRQCSVGTEFQWEMAKEFWRWVAAMVIKTVDGLDTTEEDEEERADRQRAVMGHDC